MNYPESSEARPDKAADDRQRLVLDGTVHIEEPEDEPAPRIKGLIELLSQFLRQREREHGRR